MNSERCKSGLLASFPGPCASSGGRLPEALFMVFYWIPKVLQKFVYFVDPENVLMLKNEYLLQKSASMQPRMGLSKIVQKVSLV